jgi:EmrB/QacA subfamily drug resistance transporter
MDTSTTLTPRRRRALLAAVMSGLLLAMLDQTIVGTALPRIVEDLGGSSLYIWVVTAYLVPATVSLPVYARLSDRYGRRPLLLVGMALFLLGSGLSAAAQDMHALIACRALQGFGGGALEGLSFILVADLFAGRRSAALQGALAGLMAVAFIGGPLIGGALTDHVGWRATFLVNLPIGLVALAVIARVLPAAVGRSESRARRIDFAGIGLLTVAIGLLLVGLTERTHPDGAGRLPGWWQPHTGGLILGGLLVTALFVVVERRAAAPLIPLWLLTDRRTGAVMLAATTGAFGLFAGVLLLPRYFQTARDVSATHSGLLIYPLLIGLLVSVNVAGAYIARRLEFRTPLLVGGGLAAAGAAGFAAFDASMPDGQSLVLMGLIGLGVGPTLSGLQIAIQRLVAPASIGAAMGTLMLLRQIGGSIALTAAASLYAGGLHGGPPGLERSATSTGHAIFAVTLVGSAIAALALLSLPRGANRLAPMLLPPEPEEPAPAPVRELGAAVSR